MENRNKPAVNWVAAEVVAIHSFSLLLAPTSQQDAQLSMHASHHPCTRAISVVFVMQRHKLVLSHMQMHQQLHIGGRI